MGGEAEPEVAEQRRRHALAMAAAQSQCTRALTLARESALLVLVARKLVRGEPDPWRGVLVAGAADGGASGRPGEGAPRLKRTRTFAPSADQVRPVRALVAHAAGTAGVDQEDAVLAVSELATNVVLHARTPFDVTVLVAPGHLRVELSDGSSILPAVAAAANEHGRGLRIVEAVSQRWGVEATATGKMVWFELAR